MAIDADDKILQDFLVEAGEIVENLGSQLVELESRAGDFDLLNAVFRGFHTIKGGAGFLNLSPMVELCHHSEDVFNSLRQGKRTVDADLMDVVLQAVDVVNAMFQALRAGRDPAPVDKQLIERLESLAQPAQAPTQRSVASQPAANTDDLTDQEFEALLDALPAGVPAPAVETAKSGQSGEITDAEFEALLDALQGAPAEKTGAARMPAVKSVSGEIVNDPPSAPAAAPVAAENTVRVDTKRLDDIMNMVGELVLVRNRLVTLKAATDDEQMAAAVANIDVVTENLQVAVMKTRMQPIKKVFGRFPRVVRDLARGLGKEVVLELQGEETDLDKNLVEALADPLVHLVRNAVDHGIEGPEIRRAAGKPDAGRVLLAAAQEGDHIRLVIADDGGGMDPELLRRKAVEKGVLDPDAAARLGREDCYGLIFLPGFSTKSEITDVSGRGVGMDVVKTRISQLNGTIDIESEPGKGTRMIIRVPLTLAIMPTLMVMVGPQVFALPLTCVAEILHLDLKKLNNIDGQRVVMVRDRPLPLFYLRQWLNCDGSGEPWPDSGHVVIVTAGAQRVGFIVDSLIGQEEVVIKPLGALLQGTPGLAGATITGNGRMALILDVPGLMHAYGRSARQSEVA
ncbi:MAG: chemotaxis protein CheA [Gammaproteobacteria bacterium]|nr:chemotaxis protein CheA [Gammaproteobacteria bacterium]